MKKTAFTLFGILAMGSAIVFAQSGTKPTAATYITDEEVKSVNALPGVDRTIKVVDIGPENFAVGIIHRAASGGAGGGRTFTPTTERCGETNPNVPADPASSGITHDSQTEGYVIVSGGGTLVTGGHIVNGRRSGADSDVTKVLNGPSCSGPIAGADVVKRVVKTGDIIIIPAGVPHGWTDITDHVDYLSFRPSARVLEAGYTNPAIKK